MAAPPWSRLPEGARGPLRGWLRSVNRRPELAPSAILVHGSAARGEFLPGYSNINVLVVLERMTQPALRAWGRVHQSWAKEKIVAPLLFTREELRRFPDVFPLEFLDIREQHVLIEGDDPFPGMRVPTAHVFMQCERELHGTLLRVRQCYVEGRGEPEAIRVALPLSFTSLLACLRGVYHVLGRPSHAKPPPALLSDLRTALRVDPSVFLDIWRWKRGLSTPGIHELPKLLERYLAGLDRVAERLTAMKHEGRAP